jgi:hypothetical protein
MQDAEWRMQDAGCRMKDAEKRRRLHSASDILHPGCASPYLDVGTLTA